MELGAMGSFCWQGIQSVVWWHQPLLTNQKALCTSHFPALH